MGLSAYVGSFDIDTTKTVSATQTVTGCGFQPKLVIFFACGNTSSTDNVANQDSRVMFGAATASANKGVAGWSDDANANSLCGSTQRSSWSIVALSSSTTLDGGMELTSMDSDGFTLTVRDQFSIAYRVSFLALGGTDLTNVAVGSWNSRSTAGDDSVTGLGFQPTGVILFTNWNTVDTNNSNERVCIGAGDGTNQYVNSIYALSGQSSSSTARYGRSGEIAAYVNAGPTTTKRGSLTSLDSDGFTINWSESNGAQYVNYIAFDGITFDVGNLLTQTDTTTTVSESGSLVSPSAIFFSGVCAAEHSADSPAAQKLLSMGAATSTSSRVAHAVDDRNARPTMEIAAAVEYDEVYAEIYITPSIVALMDIYSIDSNGFTVIMDDADTSQKFVGWFSFGITYTAPSGNPWYYYAQQ